MPTPSVRVVIPTWNGASVLAYALDSLTRQDYPNFSVLLVDNGSTDDTVASVRGRWPSVEIVALHENAGFAGAVNSAIEASTSEFLALVNNDVELHAQWITEMVAALVTHPAAGSATGRMLRWHNRTTLDNIGVRCDWDGWSGAASRDLPDGPQYDRPAAVFGACAGAGMYRRSAFDSVGCFDASFFAYCEDVDWSFRAQLRGFHCRYVPSAISYHLGSSTGVLLGRRRLLQLIVRNSAVMILKNFPTRELLRHSPEIMWSFARLAKQSIAQGLFNAYCVALVQVLLSLPNTIQKRRAIQRSAIVPGPALDEVVGPGRAFGRGRRRPSVPPF